MSPLKKDAAVKKATAAAEKATAAAKKKADAAAKKAAKKTTAAKKKANAAAKKKVAAKKKADAVAKKKAAAAKKKADAAAKKAAKKTTAAKKKANAAAKKKVAAKKKADAAAKKKAAAALKLNDNVLAKYSGGWYSAQIYSVRSDGKYDVYFPEDREVATLARTQIKPVRLPLPYWARMTRYDFVTMKFDHVKKTKDARECHCDQHDDGEYVIDSLGTGEAANKYICKNMQDSKPEGILYEFDMGYVQRILLSDVFPFGPDDSD